MITSLIAAAMTAAAYRAVLAATKNAPAGTIRAQLRVVLGGGGPGPAGEN